MNILQQIFASLSAIIISLSAQVGNINKIPVPNSQLAAVAITKVNSAINNCASSTTCAVSYQATAGNLLVVTVRSLNSSDAGISGVSDNAGSSYTSDINEKFSGDHVVAVYHTCSANSGVNTITINSTHASEVAVGVVEYSGIASSSCLDKKTVLSSGTTDPTTSGALTPSMDGELSVGIFNQTVNSSTMFNGVNGYTCVNIPDTIDGDLSAQCYKTLSGLASNQATASFNNGSQWYAYQLLFLPKTNSTSAQTQTNTTTTIAPNTTQTNQTSQITTQTQTTVAVPVTTTPTVTTSPVSGNQIYISQNGAGAANGSSCSSALPASFFNTSSNWASSPTSGKISPGAVVHLCGTFTGSSGSTLLTFQGGGTSGNRITLLFEPNAVLQAPYWSTTNGAINTNSKNYITIDGGTNGVIRNTDNGTAKNNQQDSIGIQGMNSNNLTIQNLSILDLYVRVALTPGSVGFNSSGIAIDNGENVLITRNNITNVKTGVGYGFTANHANLEVAFNKFLGVEVPVIVASVQANTTFTNFLLHDNDFAGDAHLWDDPVGNGFHHEALHMWAQAPLGNNHIVGTKVYNNYIHGIWGKDQGYYNATGGSHITTLLYFEETGGDVAVFNNVLDLSAGGILNRTDNGMIFCKESVGQVCNIYNNTFISSNGDVGFENTSGSGHLVKNNIFYNVAYPIYVPNGNNAVIADYNLYYGANNWGRSFDTWAEWRASGQDAHGLNGVDPQLDSNFKAQASVASGIGANLASASGIVAVPVVTTPVVTPTTQPVSAPTTTTTATNSTYIEYITKTLKRGSSGTQVGYLQTALVSEGLLLAKYKTNYFGTVTETALKAFQTKYGIVTSGTPSTTGYGATGPFTRAKLNEILNR